MGKPKIHVERLTDSEKQQIYEEFLQEHSKSGISLKAYCDNKDEPYQTINLYRKKVESSLIVEEVQGEDVIYMTRKDLEALLTTAITDAINNGIRIGRIKKIKT